MFDANANADVTCEQGFSSVYYNMSFIGLKLNVKRECIPVGCVPYAAVAVCPATHAPYHAHPYHAHPLPQLLFRTVITNLITFVFGRDSNGTVYVQRTVCHIPQTAARTAGGDAALYPAQNDVKTFIVNNDYNAQPAGYI